LFLYL